MNRYIDADKLKAEIEKRMNILDLDSPFGIGGRIELELVLDTITSLQQEQPTKGYDEKYLNEKIAKAKKSWEGVDVDKFMDDVRGRKQQEQPEVELEKDVESYLDGFIKTPTRTYFRDAIRHFYELGINARKEE